MTTLWRWAGAEFEQHMPPSPHRLLVLPIPIYIKRPLSFQSICFAKLRQREISPASAETLRSAFQTSQLQKRIPFIRSGAGGGYFRNYSFSDLAAKYRLNSCAGAGRREDANEKGIKSPAKQIIRTTNILRQGIHVFSNFDF